MKRLEYICAVSLCVSVITLLLLIFKVSSHNNGCDGNKDGTYYMDTKHIIHSSKSCPSLCSGNTGIMYMMDKKNMKSIEQKEELEPLEQKCIKNGMSRTEYYEGYCPICMDKEDMK